MKKINLIFLMTLLTYLVFSQSDVASALNITDDRTSTTHDFIDNITFDCILNDPVAYMTYTAWATEEAAVDNSPFDVSVSEEEEYAEEALKELRNDYTFIESGPVYDAVSKVLGILVDHLPSNKQGYNYRIYILDDDEVNAYTIGGGIILITTGMLEQINTTSELAGILAHEMGHDESRDINRQLVRMKGAGEFADVAMVVKFLLTMSWNQFNEIRADCYSVNLLYASGYKPCSMVSFWKRMSEQENVQPNDFMRFFRTHPYSQERADCLKQHIKRYFGENC